VHAAFPELVIQWPWHASYPLTVAGAVADEANEGVAAFPFHPYFYGTEDISHVRDPFRGVKIYKKLTIVD
jgi:hypothetical protein